MLTTTLKSLSDFLREDRAYLATIGLGLIVCIFIVIGYDGARIFQILVFVLPLLLVLRLNIHNRYGRSLLLILALAWTGLFILDSVVRAYLLGTYQALPDSSLVVSAIANTNKRESLEYAVMYANELVFWALTLVLGFAGLLYTLHVWWKNQPQKGLSKPLSMVVCALIALMFCIGLAIKPWRKHHPLQFWPTWWEQVAERKLYWDNMALQRAQLLRAAERANVGLDSVDSNTVMIVIGESINRDNLSIYGYHRLTSPKLQAKAEILGGSFHQFSYAWSRDAATIDALHNFFFLGAPSLHSSQHLLALARSAGYKVWWISNHDDFAIEQEHAKYSQQTHFINAKPGRSSNSLDMQVLPYVKEALADQSQHKLIVVHLLGAHPHYRMRYPSSMKGFAADQIDEQLVRQGRNSWARTLRREYDNALLYHDQVLDSLVGLAQQSQGARSLLYFSDHGQEVVHNSDHVGHSSHTAAGYKVPVFIWQSEPRLGFRNQHLVRTDWLGWTALSLLKIKWDDHVAERDVSKPNYRWTPPPLPIKVNFES